jgi:N-acetylmuramoyl-L-alanine amidase
VKPTHTSIVKNQSSREGGRPKLIVLHTTEGGTFESLINEFNNSESEASSHVANNARGESIRFVRDQAKSWSVCSYNPYTLNIEQIAFAKFSKKEWFTSQDKQLSNTAAWCAEWSIKYGIPLRKGLASGITLWIQRSGIVQHKDLGTLGCGHSDCGSGYPQRYVTRVARLIVEEHHLGRPHSRTANRLRRLVNRQRKHYGLHPFTAPH